MHRAPICLALWFSPAALSSVGQELRRSRSDHPGQAVVSCGRGPGGQGAQYIKGVNARTGRGPGKVGKIKAGGGQKPEGSGTWKNK